MPASQESGKRIATPACGWLAMTPQGEIRIPVQRAAEDVGPYETPVDRIPVGQGPCAPPSCQPVGRNCHARQSEHFLEIASLHPPPAALRRLPLSVGCADSSPKGGAKAIEIIPPVGRGIFARSRAYTAGRGGALHDVSCVYRGPGRRNHDRDRRRAGHGVRAAVPGSGAGPVAGLGPGGGRAAWTWGFWKAGGCAAGFPTA